MIATPPVSTSISGDITIRCPQCKTVVAWEKFSDNGAKRERSWAQEFTWETQWRWPFIYKKPVPLELKCPNGCNLGDTNACS